MSKQSKNTQALRLIDKFIDNYPDTALAKEWRELTADGIVKRFELAMPVPKLEAYLPKQAKESLGVIKPLLGLTT